MTFLDELNESIALRAAGSSQFLMEAFGEELVGRLEVAEVVYDVTIAPLRCVGRNRRKLELLGYAEDSADNSLVIIVGNYFNDPTAVINKTEAKSIFGAGAHFIEQANDGWLQANLEMSSREFEYAQYFAQNLKRFDRLKFILITDATLSDRVKTIESTTVAGLPASYSIWDLRRFDELSQSESGRDDIHVDLTTWLPEGLPCLVGAESIQHARSYLAVLPGQLLADVFRQYGSQLLESNVRTFLSARGKVNKGIQATLASEPDMFLAYNNGLTTTATGVTVEQRDGSSFITAIDNWQIVNGGQTTSSLAHFIKQANNRSLDGVFVQMKLVTVEPEKAADLVSKVSRFANSQNKVNEADFFSNSPFHVRLEQISLRLKAPAKEGVQFGTGWFYERTRGQYENTRNARTPVYQKRFDLEYPKSQKIMKTDWAKFDFAWGKRPHEVSRGAQTNFMAYAVQANKLWESHSEQVGDSYFRTGVGKAIIYNQLRAAVMKSDWYGSGYLANIVAYAMSKFAYEIETQFPTKEFDFNALWARQELSAETLVVLLDIAKSMQRVLTDPNRPQSNVTQWAKQVGCWDAAKDLPLVLPEWIAGDLTDRASTSEYLEGESTNDSGKAKHETVSRVLKVDSQIWSLVLFEGTKNGVISPTEKGIIERIRIPGSIPSERQAARAIAALERSADHAIISHDAF